MRKQKCLLSRQAILREISKPYRLISRPVKSNGTAIQLVVSVDDRQNHPMLDYVKESRRHR